MNISTNFNQTNFTGAHILGIGKREPVKLSEKALSDLPKEDATNLYNALKPAEQLETDVTVDLNTDDVTIENKSATYKLGDKAYILDYNHVTYPIGGGYSVYYESDMDAYEACVNYNFRNPLLSKTKIAVDFAKGIDIKA